MSDDSSRFTRRQALLGSSLAAVTGAAVFASGGRAAASSRQPFDGQHQSGVDTPVPQYLLFAVFDVTSSQRSDLRALLQTWTDASRRFVEGNSLSGYEDTNYPPADTGEATDLPASNLTLTFGFGPSLFDGRFGFWSHRPNGLVDLPVFPGDNLDPRRTGGDLCVQACADDPVVAFHAVRNLARLGEGVVALRWTQSGSGQTSTTSQHVETPRNLLGFKDGTNNIDASSKRTMNDVVWVSSSDGPSWMVGGTYLVARRIRTHLELWSTLSLGTQESVIGRHRSSGAPLSGRQEHDPLRLDAYDPHGNLLIPAGAHVRVAAPATNGGAQILRRGFNYMDGVDPTTGELDAGLMFICFQRDVARQFVTIQNSLAGSDSLSNYTQHTGSGVFACPPGTSGRGAYLGSSLFDATAP